MDDSTVQGIESYEARRVCQVFLRHDYIIGTLDVLNACDACADMNQL